MTSSTARGVGVFSLVCFLLIASASARPQLGDILGSLVETFVENAIKTTEITILDNYCLLSRSPYLKKFEVHYRAELKCPGWTTIVGKGRDHTNPTNSELAAIKDFIGQALKKGLVTDEEAAQYL
ncbi:anti-lipopolysaccharide factor-like [Penaeus monodon]|uniref:Anti-lipopolysaccharide factor 10 n=1 Tax=Penaeus monodon TaxID=6687 RepID=A0A6F8Z157_PENMO|nr:anti-lipopolysaccharide factor-like [Penaeus monodon]BCB92165.2 anti-lipopolysaccharide factor 10 [Penaeus monodon]